MKKILLILLTLISIVSYSQDLGEIQRHLLNLVNEERSGRGLSTFVTDPLINKSSKIQSDYLSTIINLNKVSHTNPNSKYRNATDRIRVGSNLKYDGSSENITAFFYDNSKTDLEIAKEIHNNFMNSKYHRLNIIYESVDVFNEGNPPPLYYGHYVTYNKKLNYIIAVQMFPTLKYEY
tara:strand:- start:372 stop:905 length:534 start_codon:yes stop_codon:yes gene_type:complete